MGSMDAHAAVKKSIRSVRVMQSGKNIAKKTLKMKIGESRTLRVKAKSSLSKRDIKFSSTQKKVASVNKKGKIIAKKSGSARIKITVSKKGYKKKTTWVGITVRKNNNNPTTPPNNSTDTPENSGKDTGK